MLHTCHSHRKSLCQDRDGGTEDNGVPGKRLSSRECPSWSCRDELHNSPQTPCNHDVNKDNETWGLLQSGRKRHNEHSERDISFYEDVVFEPVIVGKKRLKVTGDGRKRQLDCAGRKWLCWMKRFKIFLCSNSRGSPSNAALSDLTLNMQSCFPHCPTQCPLPLKQLHCVFQEAHRQLSKPWQKRLKRSFAKILHHNSSCLCESTAKQEVTPATCLWDQHVLTVHTAAVSFRVTSYQHKNCCIQCTYPMNMKRKMLAVMRAPRDAGDSMPSMAKTERRHTYTRTESSKLS